MKAASLRSVIKSLSADEAVDWKAAESGASDGTARGLIRELQVIAQISAAHQGVAPPANGLTGSRVLPFSKLADTTVAGEVRWGSLTLRDRLGHGADGDVYRAVDSRLQREVALKLLRHRSDSSAVSLFLNEARLLARVRHPNVVTVHGADVISGQAGIWMELISGTTLHELVARQGSLGAHEATMVGAELCRGLAAIHQAGILHRDIKAQNVMREAGGRIVLMDFSVSRAADAGRTGLAGTPLYLAPELFAGQPTSPQSDVYSVGVLLYYLVTSKYPVSGSSFPDVVQAHHNDQRLRLRDARADLPASFVNAVDRALSADPSLRPASAGELEAVLLESLPRQTTNRDLAPAPVVARPGRWPLAIAAALLTIAVSVGVTRWAFRTATPPPSVALEARPWILVAAFDNRTADRNLDGVLEYALERELTSSSQFRVASRPRVDDALRLMRRPVETRLDAGTAREVALRDGGIGTLISGRVEQVGAITVLSASVMDVHSGASRASVSAEARDEKEVQQAIRNLANRLREALGDTGPTVRSSDPQLARVTTPSLAALRLYTESYAAGERDHWPAAMNLARQAVTEDPTFAVAHTWLAWTLRRNQLSKDEYLLPASKAVELSAGASESERLWITASFHQLNEDDNRALGAYEALVRLSPDHFWGVNNLVGLYAQSGRDAEAVRLALRLAELRPHDYDALYVAFDQLSRTGNLEQAAEYAHRIRRSGVYDRNPSGDAWLFDAFRAWHRGDVAMAIHELQTVQAEAMLLDQELRDAILRRGSMVFLALGRPDDARNALRLAAPNTDWHLIQATIAQAVGDISTARRETLTARITAPDPIGSRNVALNQWALINWLLVRSGGTVDAREFLAKFEPLAHESETLVGTAVARVFAAELAFAQGSTDHAIGLMNGVRWEKLGPRSVFLAKETLADALVKEGDLTGAAQALQDVTSKKHLASPDRGIWWMRCQLRLAEVYQLLDRRTEAREIARELSAMLSAAEPGFPMVERVRAILNAAR